MRRVAARVLAIAVLLALFSPPAVAQTGPALGRITKPKFKKFVSPIGNFEVEYPSGRGWTILAGRGEAVLMIAENKTGAALVAIERQALRGVLSASDVALLATSEAAGVLDRERGAIDVRQTVLTLGNRAVVALTYSRPGIKGRESFVQYAVPIGETLYRVICSVVEKESSKYAPIFGHIAASLQVPAPAPPKK